MQQRLPLLLSATALAVALLGSTPLGEAARDLASSVPPFAKKAGYANRAGFAQNAGAVGGIKASRAPRTGFLVPLGAGGKFPASVGQAGPQGVAGPKGDKGDTGGTGPQGPAGISELELVSAASANNTLAGLKEVTASCPSGKKVVGGGARIVSSPGAAYVARTRPVADLSGWEAQGNADTSGSFWGVDAYALCAKVAA